MNQGCGQWKPIETVPDEGNFLFYIPTERNEQDDGIYEGSRTKTAQGKILTIIGQHFDFDRDPVTHWMEKPLPPKGPEGSGIKEDLRRFGSSVPALNDLENEMNSIVRVFAFHEMAEDPVEIADIETLRKYTHDQLVTLPIGFYPASQTHKSPKDFDEFLDVYGFVENTGKFACGGSIDDKSYGWETFSPDIDEVVKIANSKPGRVHTVVDGDDGRLWLTSGYHLVNRVFYIITQKPYLGPDFNIPCEEPKDFDRLSLEEFKAVDPDEDIYWAEHGGYYDKQAFLDLSKGDEALAYRIYSLCEWQCPATLIDEDSATPIGDCVFPELREAEVLDDQPIGIEPLFSEHLGSNGLDDKPRDRLEDMRGLVTFAKSELNINLREILELHGMRNFDEAIFYQECAKELTLFGYFVFNGDWFEIYSKESIIEYVTNQ